MSAGYSAIANRILEERGYLVCAFKVGPRPLPEIGDVLRFDIQGIPGPFAVVGHATKQEYIDQAWRYATRDDFIIASIRADECIAFFKIAAE